MAGFVKRLIKNNRWVWQMVCILGRMFFCRERIDGKNNLITAPLAILKGCHFKINGNNNVIKIADYAILENVNFVVLGDNHNVVIGRNCHIAKGSFWCQNNNCRINIGKYTSIEEADFAAMEGVTVNVGEQSMLSFGIDIRAGDSHSVIDIERKTRLNKSKDIIIGNHVWIGANVTVLKGVVVADDVIVGNRTVLTHSVLNSNVAVAGNPAKIVKKNVTWVRELV